MNINAPIFQDVDKAREYLEAERWPYGPICPHCGEGQDITALTGKSHRPGLYQCKTCAKQFTVTVGTVFERSKIPLTKWLLATRLMCSSKKGMSAHQLHRMLGVTYKTAWFMAHRIRKAMEDDSPQAMGGGGQIMADETYKGLSKKSKFYRKGHKHLWSVVSLIDPATGEARTFHVRNANADTVRDILVRNASREAILVTDDAHLYRSIGPEFADHKRVRHGKREYVTKDGHTTNPVETYFSIFKRGMRGVYQHCSEQHLQRYLHEFSFRWTYRKIDDTERTAQIVYHSQGKRLTYRRINEAWYA